ADRNRSHGSTSKTPSYTKSVSWQHHLAFIEKGRWQFFLTIPGNAHIFILLFTPLLGIKRRARLIKTAHEHLLRDATSSRVKQSVLTESRGGVFAGCLERIALACRWPVSGQCGGDTR
ncbi:hypothetical protein, partial [Klebsiella grimontii]|uniref:hypothetical protein n=1 Tax=Klebsiella grimontii TaxID=2058152 RepID=UPI0029305117